MATFQECLDRAYALAQAVVNDWASHSAAGHALSPAFMVLYEKACLYRSAKEQADQHRSFGLMSASAASDPDYKPVLESMAAEETDTREAFCKAFRDYRDKQSDS